MPHIAFQLVKFVPAQGCKAWQIGPTGDKSTFINLSWISLWGWEMKKNIWDKYKKVKREIRFQSLKGKNVCDPGEANCCRHCGISLSSCQSRSLRLPWRGRSNHPERDQHQYNGSNKNFKIYQKFQNWFVCQNAQAAPSSSVHPWVPHLIYASYVILFISRCHHHQSWHDFCQLQCLH